MRKPHWICIYSRKSEIVEIVIYHEHSIYGSKCRVDYVFELNANSLQVFVNS